MKLVFALAFAFLIAGAGLPKPASPPEAMGQEELKALKERCNTKRNPLSSGLLVSGICGCHTHECEQSCSKAELELLAEAFPKWHKKYTHAVSRCIAANDKRRARCLQRCWKIRSKERWVE